MCLIYWNYDVSEYPKTCHFAREHCGKPPCFLGHPSLAQTYNIHGKRQRDARRKKST